MKKQAILDIEKAVSMGYDLPTIGVFRGERVQYEDTDADEVLVSFADADIPTKYLVHKSFLVPIIE